MLWVLEIKKNSKSSRVSFRQHRGVEMTTEQETSSAEGHWNICSPENLDAIYLRSTNYNLRHSDLNNKLNCHIAETHWVVLIVNNRLPWRNVFHITKENRKSSECLFICVGLPFSPQLRKNLRNFFSAGK